MIPPRLTVGIASAGLAAVLFIVSLATTSWATIDTAVGEVGIGLFKLSTPVETGDYPKVPSSLKAVRALEIIGFLGEVAGGTLGVLVFLIQHNRESSIKFHVFAFATLGVAELLAIIGCVVFRYVAYKDLSAIYGLPDAYLGYSFYLAVIASIVGVLSGSVILSAGRRMTQQEYSPMP